MAPRLSENNLTMRKKVAAALVARTFLASCSFRREWRHMQVRFAHDV